MLNRRNVMTGAAVTGAAAACGACSTTTTGQVTLNPAVIDEIQKVIAQGCNVLPTVQALVGIVAAGFPTLIGAATVTTAVAQEIGSLFCKSVTAAPAQGKEGGELSIRVGDKDVAAHGFKIVNGKLVAF